jgi:hypothetical protein
MPAASNDTPGRGTCGARFIVLLAALADSLLISEDGELKFTAAR